VRKIAIIPARGGSKRIPFKNIKLFNGFPIIKYSIDVALKSKLFDDVIVSTDDEKIKDIAISYGASVPFIRSDDTSNDTATLADVILEVINEFDKINVHFDIFCVILPTSPFINEELIRKAMKIFESNDCNSVIPIVKYSYPIQRALEIRNGLVSMISPENYRTRSQDLSSSYHDSGMFYVVRCIDFLKERRFLMKNTIPIIVPEHLAHDIDTEEDWRIAELKFQLINQLKNQNEK
jgi:pseudaminic acid cytidylyltransferase